MLSAADGPLLVAFAAVVRRGSFSGAADELKLSKSVISERVRQLEERCGARLLERTTRRLHLTEAGKDVSEAALRVQDALGQLDQRLDARRREPSGVLRVATTSDLGPLLLSPVTARFVSAYPRVSVQLLAEDTARDLLEARLDLAVRLGAPARSSFVARRLASLAEPIVAAPALAGRLRAAERPSDLTDAPWVKHSLLVGGSLRFTGPGGARDEVTPSFRAEANSGSTVLALLLNGAGVGVFPEHGLREHLHQGRLVQLCPGWVWKTVSLYALTPSGASASPSVRAFLAMLQEQLALDEVRWRPR